MVSLRRDGLKRERASKLVRLRSHLQREKQRRDSISSFQHVKGEDDEDVVVVGEDACAAEDAAEYDWDVMQTDVDEADIQHIVSEW